MKRKTYYLILIVTSLIIAQSYPLLSQSVWKFTPAVVIGVQIPRITGEHDTWNPVKFMTGIIVPIANINASFSLRGEVNLSMQGSKWEENGIEGKTNMLYINVPLVLRYKHASGFFGEVGIQPGYLISAKDIIEGETTDFYDHLNKFDIGIPIGAGYEFANNIGIGLRVTPGLLTVSQTESNTDHNLVIALRVTYTFL